MGERYGIPVPDVIMNCPPLSEQACRKDPGKLVLFPGDGDMKPGKIVLYQGGLSAGRGIENLVEAVRYFRDDILLVLLGQGPLKESLLTRVKRLGLEKKVFFHDYVPYAELLSYTAGADAGIITYRNTCLNNYYCAPNKLFEYVAAGLPVAACRFPELERIVRDHEIGTLFDPDSPSSIAEAVNGIFASDTRCQVMRRNASRVREKFNWANEAEKLLGIYDTILKQGRVV